MSLRTALLKMIPYIATLDENISLGLGLKHLPKLHTASAGDSAK
jgi:hypothetical protein